MTSPPGAYTASALGRKTAARDLGAVPSTRPGAVLAAPAARCFGLWACLGSVTDGPKVDRRSGPRGCSRGARHYACRANTTSVRRSSVQSPRRCRSSERRMTASADGASTHARASPYRTHHHPFMSAPTPRLTTKRKRTLHRKCDRSHGAAGRQHVDRRKGDGRPNRKGT